MDFLFFCLLLSLLLSFTLSLFLGNIAQFRVSLYIGKPINKSPARPTEKFPIIHRDRLSASPADGPTKGKSESPPRYCFNRRNDRYAGRAAACEMADPFKVIGGTDRRDGGRWRCDGVAVALLIRFLQSPSLPAVPLIPGDYHLMPPLGRQFRKTVRCCSLFARGQTSRLENVSAARSGFNRISKFITAAGSIMDSKSRPQTR